MLPPKPSKPLKYNSFNRKPITINIYVINIIKMISPLIYVTDSSLIKLGDFSVFNWSNWWLWLWQNNFLPKKPIQNNKDVNILHMDSYYLPKGDQIIKSPAGNPNFDHPDAFDWELLRNHLTAISNGQPVEVPTYNFITNSRNKETMLINLKRY